MTLTESEVEEATLSWLASLGYASLFGPDIAPEEPTAERESFLRSGLFCPANASRNPGAIVPVHIPVPCEKRSGPTPFYPPQNTQIGVHRFSGDRHHASCL